MHLVELADLTLQMGAATSPPSPPTSVGDTFTWQAGATIFVGVVALVALLSNRHHFNEELEQQRKHLERTLRAESDRQNRALKHDRDIRWLDGSRLVLADATRSFQEHLPVMGDARNVVARGDPEEVAAMSDIIEVAHTDLLGQWAQCAILFEPDTPCLLALTRAVVAMQSVRVLVRWWADDLDEEDQLGRLGLVDDYSGAYSGALTEFRETALQIAGRGTGAIPSVDAVAPEV